MTNELSQFDTSSWDHNMVPSDWMVCRRECTTFAKAFWMRLFRQAVSTAFPSFESTLNSTIALCPAFLTSLKNSNFNSCATDQPTGWRMDTHTQTLIEMRELTSALSRFYIERADSSRQRGVEVKIALLFILPFSWWYGIAIYPIMPLRRGVSFLL